MAISYSKYSTESIETLAKQAKRTNDDMLYNTLQTELLNRHNASYISNLKLPSFIPQYFEPAITIDYLKYKASSGSYKATIYLNHLLEFSAVSVLGGDPFMELSSIELEDKLRIKYFNLKKESKEDPIKMAIKWAWPPSNGGWIVFEYIELMKACEALYFLIQQEPTDIVISRVISQYRVDEADETDFYDLGNTFKYLNYSKQSLELFSGIDEMPNILKGYNSNDT